MGTTKVIVEYIIAGILMLLALAFLVMSISGVSLTDIQMSLPKIQGLGIVDEITFSIFFFSIAYAVGVVSEYLSLESLEWYMELVRRRRAVRFLEDNRANLHKSPLFKGMTRMKKSPPNIEEIYGKMRFHVMHYSEPLYAEINDQLNLVRLVRVLLIAELIVIVPIIKYIIRMFSAQMELSSGLTALIFLIFTIVTIFSIRRRFNHYCRAVEYSYKVLVFDP